MWLCYYEYFTITYKIVEAVTLTDFCSTVGEKLVRVTLSQEQTTTVLGQNISQETSDLIWKDVMLPTLCWGTRFRLDRTWSASSLCLRCKLAACCPVGAPRYPGLNNSNARDK